MKKIGLIFVFAFSVCCLYAKSWTDHLKDYNAHHKKRDYAGGLQVMQRAIDDPEVRGKAHSVAHQFYIMCALPLRQYNVAVEKLEHYAVLPDKDLTREMQFRVDIANGLWSADRQLAIRVAFPFFAQKAPEGKPFVVEKKLIPFCKNMIFHLAGSGDKAGLEKLLSMKENLPPLFALELDLILDNGKSVSARKTELDALGVQKQYDLLCRVASALYQLKEEDAARAVLAESKKLEVPFVRNTYLMKGMMQAPGSWTIMDDWKGSGGATGFTEYSRQAQAALMLADVASDRSGIKNLKEDEKAAKLEAYRTGTTFHAVYDVNGVHFFVISPEKDLEQFVAKGTGAGMLECFIAPGEENVTYQQFLIYLPGGKVDCIPKNSILKTNRNMADYLKTETYCRDGKMGTYIFLPWEYFHDVLPFDTGKNWRFNVVRWTPAGGVSWGRRVHELGRMGNLVWGDFDEKLVNEIRRRLANRAIAKYQGVRD
ncbi:MAG: hypothetical protein J6Q65_06660, partial [Lentisphaeria bacterium]|nr:hypothetical protein [Lentisphaeria bacterium]